MVECALCGGTMEPVYRKVKLFCAKEEQYTQTTIRVCMGCRNIDAPGWNHFDS